MAAEVTSHLSEEEFDRRMAAIMPRDLAGLSNDELGAWMGVFISAHDTLLNEAERRGMIRWDRGSPTIPYDVPETRWVETVLTRDGEGDESGSRHTH